MNQHNTALSPVIHFVTIIEETTNAAMDSPDHKPSISSSDCQGSPFFHFLCSLSPIKLMKSGQGTQTFSELTFPPPPAVFVSPKAESHRESARSKRKILAETSEMVNNAVGKDEVNGGSSQLRTNIEKEPFTWRQTTNDQQNHLDTRGSQSVPAFSHAPSLKAVQNSEGHLLGHDMKTSQHSSRRPSVTPTDVQRSRWETACLTSGASSVTNVKQELGQESAGNLHQESAGNCKLPASQVKGVQGPFADTHGEQPSFHNGNHVKMLNQSVQSDINLDQNRDAFGLASYASRRMSACLPVPLEDLSRILASLRGVLNKDIQAGKFNSDLQQATIEPSNLNDTELQNQILDHGSKTTITGVPRRCLDFEPLEMQQDNLHTQNSIDNTQNVFLTTPEAEPASMVSFGAEPSMVWDHGMHTSSSSRSQYASVHEQSIGAYRPSQHNTSNFSNPVLPLQLGTRLNSHCLGSSIPEFCRPDKTGNGSTLPYAARSIEGFRHSSPQNENALLQGRCYPPDDYFRSLDQQLLAALVKRTGMHQHDLLLANSGAHLGVSRPMNYYQPLMFGVDPVEQKSQVDELENDLSSLAEKGIVLQETSHQSESDHQEDSTHSPRSPKKKRKLAAQTGDMTGDGGCKNCKCKKSKCLKLYCECFAAGVYCIDICNCRDCYNKPEFEETVLGTRQQIESRNPLAFLPKIIRTSDTSPTQGEESKDTPASARHKRGCNCKKSQCLKKYCECYQAGVGCAEGCRCEGCKNIYGRNEGNGDLDDKDEEVTVSELRTTTNDGSAQMVFKPTPEHQKDQPCRDLSPFTPFLENSGQYRSDIENLGSPFEPQASTLSLQSPSRILEFLEETENFENVNLPPCQAADKGSVADSQHLTTGWDVQDELYTTSPPMQPLQQLAPALADALFNKGNSRHSLWGTHQYSSSNINSHIPGLANPDINQTSLIEQMTPLSVSPDSSQFQTPENALAIPVTPLLSTMYASRPQYDLEEVSESQNHQSVWFTNNDDTPNVLREINTFSAPNIIRKTRSPQQKRVFSYQHNLKSTGNYMPALGSRNGRKFVLHALPSSGYSDRPRDSV